MGKKFGFFHTGFQGLKKSPLAGDLFWNLREKGMTEPEKRENGGEPILGKVGGIFLPPFVITGQVGAL